MTYRDPAKARSPALEQLAAAKPELVAQTGMLSEADVERRLELAADVYADRTGTGMAVLAMILATCAFTSLFFIAISATAGIVTLALVGGTFGAGFFAKRDATASEARRQLGVAKTLAWADAQPFPVTGYRDWLVNDRSVFLVELQKPIEKETFVDAAKAIDPAIEADAIDDTQFSVVIPSRVVTGETPARYGNVELLQTVWSKLVLPLHGDVGIERVVMGGTVQDRR